MAHSGPPKIPAHTLVPVFAHAEEGEVSVGSTSRLRLLTREPGAVTGPVVFLASVTMI